MAELKLRGARKSYGSVEIIKGIERNGKLHGRLLIDQ